MTLTNIRSTAIAALLVVLGIAALQAYGDDGGGKPENDNKITVVLKVFVDVPSGYRTPFARGDVRGHAGQEKIEWLDIKFPPTPAAVRAVFVVDHGALLEAGVVIKSGPVEGVHCRWYLDDASHGFEGTGIGTSKTDNMNGISALCAGKAP